MKKLKLLSIFAMALAMAGVSNAADEEVLGKYGAITIKKVGDKTVAFIDDESNETPVIEKDINVDSVYYSRVFKASVPSTLMLPFSVPTWKTGLSVFEYVDVVKDCDNCEYRINVRTNYSQEVKANTPYVVISEGRDLAISFNLKDINPSYVTLNTINKSKGALFTRGSYDWNIIGTYEYIKFTKPAGIYGFAAKNKNETKMGDFKKAACNEKSCAFIRPFRAYLQCSMTKKASAVKGLAKVAEETLDNLPETIEVRVVDADSGTTSLGRINTYTGEFIKNDDRWYDMKGRKLQHKPTAKGTYYNNRKMVVIK